MVTNDAAASALHGRSNCLEIAVTAVQNEGESLVRYAEKTSGACDAAAGLFKGATNQVSFIAQYFSVERKVWRY